MLAAASARPPSNPGFVYGPSNSVTPPVSQYPVVQNDSPVVLDHTQSPHHFGAGPAAYHQPTTVFYGAQRASPAFGFADQHPAAAFLVSSSSQPEESCPPAPIPLPSEVPRGQSLTMAGFESQELSAAALVSNVAQYSWSHMGTEYSRSHIGTEHISVLEHGSGQCWYLY